MPINEEIILKVNTFSMVTGKQKAKRKSRKNKREKSEYRATSVRYFEGRSSAPTIDKFYVPVMQQLSILLMKEPENTVYKSIFSYSHSNPLSPKQLQLIQMDFDKKVRKKNTSRK